MRLDQATWAEFADLALPILAQLEPGKRNWIYEDRLRQADCTYEVAKALCMNGLASMGLARPPDAGAYDPKVIDTEFYLRITPAGTFFLNLNRNPGGPVAQEPA